MANGLVYAFYFLYELEIFLNLVFAKINEFFFDAKNLKIQLKTIWFKYDFVSYNS
jgi:hypothetical protein